MSTIYTLLSTDLINDTFDDINTNFSNLNTDKAEDSAVVHDTGNETIAGVKTFSDEVKITYGKGIFNNGFPTIPALKTDWAFPDTGGGDSTRITPAGSAVTSNMVYSGSMRNGSKGDFYVEGKQTVTGNIELGNASDTTISRVSAGVIAVEGDTVPTTSSTSTLTNKRVTRRLVAVTQSATPAINTDNMDIASITGLAQAITSMTSSLTGTPVNGDMMMIQITDNGTARAITWGASFASANATLPTTTVISTLLRVLVQWNSTTSKWECIA